MSAPLEWWEHAQLDILQRIAEGEPDETELFAAVEHWRAHPDDWRRARAKLDVMAKVRERTAKGPARTEEKR